MRVGAPGAEIPVVITPDSQYRDMRPLTADIDGAFWTTGGPDRVRAALQAGRLPVLDIDGLRIGPPVARPGVVLCVGMNYAAHAAETAGVPQDLGLRSWVNGEPRQDSSTKDMIFTIAELIYQLSQVSVLDPGDVVNTGTPEGVALSGRYPYLAPGDVIELEIEGLGRQRQQVRQA
jgi:2-keto-4-pentenoate hydratase/2-oxohepta-3-ene-1,7-dioic acid hydratase in catechol pathway